MKIGIFYIKESLFWKLPEEKGPLSLTHRAKFLRLGAKFKVSDWEAQNVQFLLDTLPKKKAFLVKKSQNYIKGTPSINCSYGSIYLGKNFYTVVANESLEILEFKWAPFHHSSTPDNILFAEV